MNRTLFSIVVAGTLLTACGGSGSAGKPAAVSSGAVVAPVTPAAPTGTAPAATGPTLSLAAQLGRKLFFDATLSGSGKQSCATCHDPGHAYGPPNDLAVQLGGADLTHQGRRAVPSLRYRDMTPAYADLLDNPDGISAPGPGGGFTWDGRAATLAEQTRVPLLNVDEMANASVDELAAKLRKTAYADLFRQAFGATALDKADGAVDVAGKALQAFQLEDPSFHPYSSKFDLYAGNKIGGSLTPAEERGLKLFSDPNTANCASCHYQGAGLNGSSGLFTDFSYEAIGVPRNPAIGANANPSYFDVGLCGPERTDHPDAADGSNRFCGMFKAPSLRNVAIRTSFFHNGVIHSLEQAVRFYNTRDVYPEIWYPTVGGTPKATPDKDFPTYGLVTTQYTGGKLQKFDDLPARYRANIDTQMPLDGRAPHSAPPMTEAQMADLVCFLKTLTDADQAGGQPASNTCTN